MTAIKSIIRYSILIPFVLITINITYSQSIKKTYKALFEHRNFYTTDEIFKSDEFFNTSQGRFGIAYLYFKKTYKFQSDLSNNENAYIKQHRKVYAYHNILKAEDLFPEVSIKDKRSLSKYFSEEKIIDLKNSLENYFLKLNFTDLRIAFDSLKKVCKDKAYYSALENKYIIVGFNYYNKYNSHIDEVVQLIEKFPNNENVPKMQRWIDSVRYVKARSIKDCSFLIHDYPDNQFKTEIFNKIKTLNTKYKEKDMLTKNYILVINEAGTEEEIIKLLAERYYSYTPIIKHEKPPYYHYTELSDATAKRYNLKNRFLIYLPIKTINTDGVLRVIDYYRPHYENCYALDPFYDVQIFSRDKVYLKGKLLDSYRAIVILPIGEYSISITEHSSFNPMKTVFESLRSKTMYQIIAWHDGNYKVSLNIEDNPYGVEFDLLQCSGFDPKEEVINIIFVSNNKTYRHFEIAPDNIDRAEEIIIKKAEMYFK